MPLPSAGRTDLDWVDFAVEQGIDLLAVSFVRRAEDLEPVERRVRAAGADIPLIAKIEKPQAAENAEAIIRAALGGIMVARGDLGIEMRDRAGAGGPEAAAGAGRTPLPAVDHRDPDARLDGGLAPAHPSGGLRRGRRDLPGNRRRDAVGGDGGRRVSGRGGAGDGPDRPRGRARPPVRRLAVQPRRPPSRRTSPARSPGRPLDRPTPWGWPPWSSPPGAAARRGWFPRTGRACRCWRSHRGSRRCAGSSSCSASAAPSPRTGRASEPCWTSAPGWPGSRGSPAAVT